MHKRRSQKTNVRTKSIAVGHRTHNKKVHRPFGGVLKFSLTNDKTSCTREEVLTLGYVLYLYTQVPVKLTIKA